MSPHLLRTRMNQEYVLTDQENSEKESVGTQENVIRFGSLHLTTLVLYGEQVADNFATNQVGDNGNSSVDSEGSACDMDLDGMILDEECPEETELYSTMSSNIGTFDWIDVATQDVNPLFNLNLGEHEDLNKPSEGENKEFGLDRGFSDLLQIRMLI